MQLFYLEKKKMAAFQFCPSELQGTSTEAVYEDVLEKLYEALLIINAFGLHAIKIEDIPFKIYLTGNGPGNITAYVVFLLNTDFQLRFFKAFGTHVRLHNPAHYSETEYSLKHEHWKQITTAFYRNRTPGEKVFVIEEDSIFALAEFAKMFPDYDGTSCLMKVGMHYELVYSIPYMDVTLLMTSIEYKGHEIDCTIQSYVVGKDLVIKEDAIKKLNLLYS